MKKRILIYIVKHDSGPRNTYNYIIEILKQLVTFIFTVIICIYLPINIEWATMCKNSCELSIETHNLITRLMWTLNDS